MVYSQTVILDEKRQRYFKYLPAIMTVYCHKGDIMEALVYTHARNNLRTLINNVCTDFTEYIISTKDNKSAVLISQEEYNSMKETLYLLSSRNNRERLLDAVDEIEKGNFTQRELLE